MSSLKIGNALVCPFENDALTFNHNIRNLKSKFAKLFNGDLPDETTLISNNPGVLLIEEDDYSQKSNYLKSSESRITSS